MIYTQIVFANGLTLEVKGIHTRQEIEKEFKGQLILSISLVINEVLKAA
jgi:hypothetical protein